MSNDPDKKNLPQVRPNKDIALVSKQLATVNKALTTINREKFIKFLERNKDAARFFIDHISLYSNVLDMGFIEQYCDQLDWEKLSNNNSLSWSEELIERYADKWNWGALGLSVNKSLPWSETLIESYKEKWDWGVLGLSVNKSLPWSELLIKRFKHRWDWKTLSGNNSLPWSESLIERFADKWEWGGRFGLSHNKSLPWSESFIERFADKWEWGGNFRSGLPRGHLGCLYLEYRLGLSGNKFLPWSVSLIERYKDKLDWGRFGLSGNKSLPWSESLIERYKDKWSWDGLSSNESLPWSELLIEGYKGVGDNVAEEKVTHTLDFYPRYRKAKYNTKPEQIFGYDNLDQRLINWVFTEFEKDHGIDISKDNMILVRIEEGLPKAINDLSTKSETEINLPFISADTSGPKHLNMKLSRAKYESMDKWNWKGLSSNKSLPWSEAFIERYEDRWSWEMISRNDSLPWSESLIERYKDKWHWRNYGLSSNQSLPWSESFIERYADKWDWGRLGLSSNKSLPWNETFIERFANKWGWTLLASNKGVRKVFNSWTKQEISTALERIRSVHNKDNPYSGEDDVPSPANMVAVKAIWNWADKNKISKDDIPREKDALLNLKRLSFINLDYIGEKQFTSLPKEIGNLKNLILLQLGDVINEEMVLNRLTELPIEICELPKLAYLHLQRNALNELPTWIGKLTKLKELKLGGNFLKSLPKEIGTLEKLEVLTIWQNDLEEIPKEIGFLKNLRGLDISFNKLTKLPNEITNLTELKTFWYDDEKVKLSEEQKKWVTKLKNNGCEL